MKVAQIAMGAELAWKTACSQTERAESDAALAVGQTARVVQHAKWQRR